MPTMTGEKLAIELKKIRPDLPIVLCTGYREESMEEKVKTMGIRALIIKPFQVAEMAHIVRYALGNKHSAEIADMIEVLSVE